MENASKALVMAGAILITIMVLGMFIFFFAQLKEFPKQQDEAKKLAQISKFNQEYESYYKKKMYGTDVKKQGVKQNSCELASHPYDYNHSLNSFVELSGSGCGGICSANYVLVNKIKSVKSFEDSLLIEVYYFNTSCDYDSEHKQISCKVQTPKINQLITANDRESVEKEILSKYLDKLDVYEVQFQLKGNDYIFKNVIKK